MGPKKKQVHNHGLGKALMNHRAKTQKLDYERELHTTEVYENKPISVTQESDLENFLNTAAMADMDFTAERQNVTIISTTGSGGGAGTNPHLLSAAEHASLQAAHRVHKDLLRVPRRPKWTGSTTAAELNRLERDAFLDWRKGLAELTDNRSLLLTPFERNIEVWRQLWRVVERSQLIVQIVDARNPLRFRCEDLEKYVDELSEEGLMTSQAGVTSGPGALKLKANLLLVNKADLLTENQRQKWAEYFDSQGIQYAFFSASEAAALQAIQELQEPDSEEDGNSSPDELDSESKAHSIGSESQRPANLPPTSATDSRSGEAQSDLASTADTRASMDPVSRLSTAHPSLSESKIKVLTVAELEQLFLRHAETTLIVPASSSNVSDEGLRPAPKLVVGLVGYPNVGKSSTINALVGAKKVSVSATPGKTKHFQTIHLSPEVVLCDCPGLVFPQFASTKAELVCDGVLPIDQMREHTGPISLVTQRIPKAILEATYGLQLQTLPAEEGGDGVLTASEFLTAYAIARGAFTGGGGMGRPDESKVSRPILKDYVSAKLLYCDPPPLPGLSADEFNAETRALKLDEFVHKKLAPTNRVPLTSDTYVSGIIGDSGNTGKRTARSRALDQNFFESNIHDQQGSSKLVSNVKVGVRGRRNQRTESEQDAFARLGIDSKDLYNIAGRAVRGNALGGMGHAVPEGNRSSKKHYKAAKRNKKMRSGKGYDEV